MANETDTDAGSDRRVLHIRYKERDEDRLREVVQAMDRGEADSVEPFYEVTFHEVEDFHRVTRPKNLQLLRAVAQYEPASIRETARIVERDVHQVHTNLEELAELHLIEFETEGNAKSPRVWYDDIEVHFSLTDETADDPASKRSVSV